MNESYLPSNEAKLTTWFSNFLTVANANLVALGLTASDLINLSEYSGSFNGSIGAYASAKATLATRSVEKTTFRKEAVAAARALGRNIQANPNVPDSLRQNLGLPVRKTPVGPVMPAVPAALVATPDAAGFNALKWHRNGNTSGVVYLVQAKGGANADWTQIGAATATRFTHDPVTPGMPVKYRVLAQRGVHASAVSNEAPVYGA